jgi:glycosyltransferase involved in cell wall biosynthesis
MGKLIRIRKQCSRGRVLFVAYPLLPVSDESAGGAEQVLSTVEREASRAGWLTTTAACNGSIASGQVYSTTSRGRGSLDSARKLEAQHCKRVLELVSVRASIGTPFDIIHDHSGSFFCHGGNVDTPVLATLHLPRSFYPRHWFNRIAPNVYFNCVSKAQARTFSDLPNVIGVVRNGISLDRFKLQIAKKDYLLWMGRICEEKGTHTAIDVAQKTGLPIVIVGRVYPFAYHQDYFEREIRPRLDRMGDQVRYIERPTFAQKVELIQNARALVVTSSAEETSCLVAMEAAACGTPVIALRRGAFGEVVEHGVSGYVVSDMSEMAAAIAYASRIKPMNCRDHAQRNFSAVRMFADYEKLYDRLRAQKLPESAPELPPTFAA